MMKNKGFRKFVKCAAGVSLAAAAYIGTSGPRWWALAWALAFGWIGYNLARRMFAWIDENRRRKARIRKIKNSTAAELEKRNIIRCAAGFADEVAYAKAHRNDGQCVVIKGVFGR